MEQSPKLIAYDLFSAQPSIDSKYHGGGEYIKAVFEQLVSDYQGRGAQITALYSQDRFLDDWLKDLMAEKNVATVNIDSLDDMFAKIASGEVKCDIFYSAGTITFDRNKLPKDLVTIGTFHDLRDFEEPVDSCSHMYYDGIADKIKQRGKYIRRSYLRKRNLARYNACAAGYDKIVCVSEHTRSMMETYMPGARDKIAGVLYTPSKHYMAPTNIAETSEGTAAAGAASTTETGAATSQASALRGIAPGYILMISTNRWIKNSYRAIQALDHLYDNRSIDCKTVLVGGLSKGIRNSIRHTEMFITVPYVNPDELEYLYDNCGLFVYPTLNEGFGMPPLEAMKYGKTCVISALCSLPELYSGAAYMVNPYSIEEMASHIYMALNTPIDKQIIEDRYDKITSRQQDDLRKLAEMIACSQ